jgi:hypothetical protein
MLNFELVKTDWFDESALRLPSYKVGRVSYGNGRSYLRIQDGMLEEPFKLYTSLTTAINTCSPMEKPLLEWYCKHGYEGAQILLKDAQRYGTLMHMEIGKYLMNNFYDFDNIPNVINEYCEGEKIEINREWKHKLKYDVAAFIAFAQYHKIQPIGIEYVLLSQKGYGTLIDLVCKMQVEEKGFYGEVYKSGAQAGQPKETKQWIEKTAIINFKSGRHGFYRSNGIQAMCEAQLFEENFPDVKIDCAFNWSPKEWKVSPDWNLKDWMGEIEQSEIEAVLALAEIRFGAKAIEKKYISLTGLAIATRPISDNITVTDVYDFCKQTYSQYL